MLMVIIGIIQIIFMCFYFYIERKTTNQIREYILENHKRTDEVLIYNLKSIYNTYIDQENYERAKEVKILLDEFENKANNMT